MAKERKSPQEKKSLEYTKDHFTFGRLSSRVFPKTWKRKKTLANREYRRKSEDLLAQAKRGIAAEDASLIVDDLTSAHFKQSVIRKPLIKADTVTVGEKVKLKLAKRQQTVGRRVRVRESAHQAASSAIRTLCSLEDERLVDFVRRVDRLCRVHDSKEFVRLQLSKDPIDQAMYFINCLASGTNSLEDTVCKDPELRAALAAWFAKANRIIRRDRRVMEEKVKQKQITEKRVQALRRAAR